MEHIFYSYCTNAEELLPPEALIRRLIFCFDYLLQTVCEGGDIIHHVFVVLRPFHLKVACASYQPFLNTTCCCLELAFKLLHTCEAIISAHYKKLGLLRLQTQLVVPAEQDGRQDAERVAQAHIAYHFLHCINCRASNWRPCRERYTKPKCKSLLKFHVMCMTIIKFDSRLREGANLRDHIT